MNMEVLYLGQRTLSIGNLGELKNRIRTIIDQEGITQTEFAKKLRISDGYVSELLSGKQKKISEVLGELISLKFGYAYNWVMFGDGEPFKYGSEAWLKARIFHLIKKYEQIKKKKLTKEERRKSLEYIVGQVKEGRLKFEELDELLPEIIKLAS